MIAREYWAGGVQAKYPKFISHHFKAVGLLDLSSFGEVIRAPTLDPFESHILRASGPFWCHRLQHLFDNPVRRNTFRLSLEIKDESVAQSGIDHCLQVISR